MNSWQDFCNCVTANMKLIFNRGSSVKKRSSGFTLIEIMIVVAVVGVLAAFSIPVYQGYVVKSQVNRTVAELSRYKTAFEEQVSRSGTVTNADLRFAPSDMTTAILGVNIGSVNADGSGHIEVTMGGSSHPHIHGLAIRLERSSGGEWACKLDNAAVTGNWQSLYLPESCSL